MASDAAHNSPLGKQTDYPTAYDPTLLVGLPRHEKAAPAGVHGADIWRAWELSWLSVSGVPRVAIAEFNIPASSPQLIESKSLKLYLNSLNFYTSETIASTIAKDLSDCAGASVAVNLFMPEQWASAAPQPPAGVCIDALEPCAVQWEVDAASLSATGDRVQERLYSDLLRSLCPVTGQPDWATVFIDYSGPKIDREGLLAYLISFRKHQDFHEHCVERIYGDILERCKPKMLTVSAQYARRGGLDINPVRSSEPKWAKPQRGFRQ